MTELDDSLLPSGDKDGFVDLTPEPEQRASASQGIIIGRAAASTEIRVVNGDGPVPSSSDMLEVCS